MTSAPAPLERNDSLHWTAKDGVDVVIRPIRPTDEPIVDLRVFKERSYAVGVFLMTVVGFVLYGSMVLLPVMLYYFTRGAVVLGGAKPVPVDPRNYRHYRTGDIIVSLAGVVTNLLIALVCTAIIALLGLAGRSGALEPSAGILQAMMVTGVRINMLLFAFNLLPIPPLDGSHVVKHVLPRAWALRYQQVGLYGLAILVMILYFAPALLNYWLHPANVVSTALIDAVRPSVLPTATRWLQ